MVENNTSEINWNQILRSLVDHGLDFVVVGGAALALHGLPRTTLDLDIFIPAIPESLQTLFDCLIDHLGLKSDQAVFRKNLNQSSLFVGQWVTFNTKDGLDLIDAFLADQQQFELLKATAEIITVCDRKIKIASLAALKKMKQECGRPIDLADVALINEILDR